MQAGRQIDRQTDRQADGRTDREPASQPARQTKYPTTTTKDRNIQNLSNFLKLTINAHLYS